MTHPAFVLLRQTLVQILHCLPGVHTQGEYRVELQGRGGGAERVMPAGVAEWARVGQAVGATCEKKLMASTLVTPSSVLR